MASDRFDAVVVGAGPAGAVAALVLARGGARVALVDKARFPRDKACGDLVGPRGVRVLDELGVAAPGGALAVGDMEVLGPTGRRALLRAFPGRTYPGHALAVPRVAFDAALRDAALGAGAEAVVGRVGEVAVDGAGAADVRVDGGPRLRADAVVGADGATSRVAAAAGLVDPRRVLWGFAVRAYLDAPVALPTIALWDPEPWRGFPGYGWLFPGPGGCANAGLGLGVGADRAAGARAARDLDAFLAHLRRLGLLGEGPAPGARLGGWLKMGMVGTVPARGRVLLVGDAAGLVNPLQGEGIAQALASGRAAAEALLAGPAAAADRYRGHLRRTFAPYQSSTAPVHAAMLARPRAVSAVGRALTAPGLSRAVAGGWSVYWNDLLDGATPGPAKAVATVAAGAARAVTAAGPTRRWFARTLG